METRLLKTSLLIGLFFVMLVAGATPALSATLYMGAGEAYTTLQSAMAAMQAGDTLIIRNGTYTGAANQITGSQHPPVSSTAWTTIKAEHDGEVFFDGQGVRDMFSVTQAGTNSHWVFEGLVWGRAATSVVFLSRTTHVKFLRCGGFDAGNGNTVVFIASAGSEYILFDGCYAWGSGRSMFAAWGSNTYGTNHIIFRSCVGRIDRVTANDPIYTFGMYSVENSLVQNCIAIDNDQTAFYNNGAGDWSGGFVVPSTDKNASNVSFYNNIVLNSHIGGLFTTANVYAAYDTLFSNNVVWDITNKSGANLNSFRGVRNILDHNTFGMATGGYIGLNGWGGTSTIFNSIITGIYSTNGTTYNLPGDYGAYYNNGTPFSGSGTAIGSNTKTTVNPVWNATSNPNGALKYITRIEAGSNLFRQGSVGDIGANLTTLRGTPGALWGETGYDSDSGIPMWPFPNEDLIKAKLSAYTGGGVNGARGFAAAGKQLNGSSDITLTSYVWEYLGNPMPVEIYSGTLDTTPPVVTAFTLPTASSDLTVDITAFSATDDVEVIGFLLSESSATPSATATGWTTTPATSYTFFSPGTKTLYAWAKDSAGNISIRLSDTVTITLPDTSAPTITSFNLPTTSSTTSVPVSNLGAADNVGVTGYLITESPTPPATTSAAWSAIPPTSFTFSGEGAKTAYAWAKDAAGNLSNGVGRSVTITLPDTTSPTVVIEARKAYNVAKGVITINATAVDNVGISRVEFYVNGVIIATATSAPYGYNWDSNTVASGSYALTAKAFDSAGNAGNSGSLRFFVPNCKL